MRSTRKGIQGYRTAGYDFPATTRRQKNLKGRRFFPFRDEALLRNQEEGYQ